MEIPSTNINDKKTIFINLFNLENIGFSKPIALKDAIGFSTTKQCDPKYLKLKDNKTYITLIKLYIDPINKPENNHYPLFISVSLNLFEDGKYIIDQTFIKNKISKPINLHSENEYFYNDKENKFYKKNVPILPNDIISEIYNIHIKPTKLIKGFPIKCKLSIQYLLILLISLIGYIFNCILWIISGKKYSYDIFGESAELKNKKEIQTGGDIKIGHTINFFGYSASLHSICVYCAIHFLLFVICYMLSIKPNFIYIILKYNFLTLIYGILSITLYEKFLPDTLIFIIKNISSMKSSIQWMKFKL